MKKKKLIIALLFSIIILPVALLFAGCGSSGQLDKKAECYTTGNYQATNAQVLTDTVGTQTNFGEGMGYRITSNIDGHVGNQKYTVVFNAIYKNNQFASKTTVKAGGVGTSTYIYYKDGYMYASVMGIKMKVQANINDVFGADGDADYISAYLNAQEVLNLVREDDSFIVSQDGNNFKVELSDVSAIENEIVASDPGIRIVDISNAVVYLNLTDQNVLTALQLNFRMAAETNEGDSVVNMSVTMNAFDGDIQFPNNLNSYRAFD